MKFETLSIHAGNRPEGAYNAVAYPIYQTSTFMFEDIGKTKGFDYSRTANPTRKVLEDTIARLEGGKAGFAFATGMAAEATAIHLLSAGDHVVCGDDVYGGTYRLFADVMTRFGIEFSFIRMDSRQRIEDAIRPNTKMIWIETPSNPLLNIVDIEMIVDIAKKNNMLSVIDNTFASPYLQNPIALGIDLVVHSTTKYLNGHCDVVSGAIVTSTDELSARVHYLQNGMGTCAAPFDSWLVLRGIETLAIRMEKHQQNAAKVADYLVAHPAVDKVFYPGLKDHPGHDIAARQMKGFGGMMSFVLKKGSNVEEVLRGFDLFALAESLGGAASLVEHPGGMSHASMPEDYRQTVGITNELIRLSIGLENADDLIDDLKKALKKA
ncbi:MAG: PLP-dependent transferase [Chloroflexi bacterium]|jgi:cystathionine beta-lyase/cystathionine gamma-synthase|nr:PLP-dependent transferase [Chloroflexota bacterium]MBT7081535.1 PLP-dependent transferase [Chloroflexota bacterium]MBT7289356.1 PLP-dependent transferase [Chloroflexota bacterium]